MKPKMAAASTISGNGTAEEEDGDEGQPRQPPRRSVLQRAPGDPEQRLDDDRQDRRLHTDEQGLDRRQLAERGIDHRQRQHHQRAGDDEQQARRQPAPDPMQPPADVGGKLHGFRPRQQHAEVERVEIARLVDPLALLHQHAVHERDLSRRAAEREEADPGPNAERLAEGRGPGAPDGNRRNRVVHVIPAQAWVLVDGQLCVSSVASRHHR